MVGIREVFKLVDQKKGAAGPSLEPHILPGEVFAYPTNPDILPDVVVDQGDWSNETVFLGLLLDLVTEKVLSCILLYTEDLGIVLHAM